jgi:HK97 family phage portal protein
MAFFRRKAAPLPTAPAHYLVAGGQIRSLADPENWLLELFGAGVSAIGLPTGRTAALKYSASAAAIRLISTACAECPIQTYRTSGGDRQRDASHQVEVLLNGFANPWTASPDFIREMTQRALLDGDSYARVIRLRSGKPVELHPLVGKVAVVIDQWTGEPTYEVSTESSGQVKLGFRDVVHLKSPTGAAPAKQAATAIETGLLLERATANLFRSGGAPSGILTVAKALTSKEAQEVKRAWKQQQMDDPSGTAVLGSDAKWTPISFSSVDLETLELRRHQILDTLRFFGISPTLAGELQDASLNNAESLGRQFLAYTLGPWLTAWISAISRTLIDVKDRATVFAEAETSVITSGDFKSMSEGLRNLVGGPVMTINDARELLHLPRIEGGDVPYPVQGASPTATAGGGNA